MVLGGDGRYFNKEAGQIIIQIAAANGAAKVIMGHNGILSTPAASCVIRALKAYGGFLMTASHNPGGPNADWGIKYNCANGGPAPEALTDSIYKETTKITEIKIAELPEIDFSKIGSLKFDDFEVEVIDSVDEYLKLMKEIYDFDKLKAFVARPDFRMLMDSLHGVTGPYVKRIFVDELGASIDSIVNAVPSEDFGGGHPDPNLTYAHDLVERMFSGADAPDFGAASDGDGDRNMVLGKNFFVNPSDSVAIIAANAKYIPYFVKNGLKGVARSMPTAQALDRVAEKLCVEFFEVPTGWKFFGNLMDAGRCQLCGEESFGTGSDHVREKDGLWAVLAWLSIIAGHNEGHAHLKSVADIVKEHWYTYGRNYFSRYDYEEVDSESANKLMARLNEQSSASSATPLVGSVWAGGKLKVAAASNFEYKDPIDHSVSSNQGIMILFEDGSRIVFRLSGTGSQGATIRVYMEQYVAPDQQDKLTLEASDALKDIVSTALEMSKLVELTGRDKPTVIT
eukprot:CAMPEP_0196655628 /NCGR_PEP_ID=MMETSP1086-20130531/5382_1 /TAXON_ID=77921 /ORGANISM="Cyanoptyche  gloeocystis , Strain SAG4.97" /LENGTH=509 /DNA_ID=CAMNT_0041988039 /DNA_START=258 /DNA_END=1787 /DNA_ORIENTATION=-